jgi:hypothetical protein
MKKLIIFFAVFSLVGMNSFGQETGLLTGTLRDQLTGDPLFGVKVTAGGHVTRTDEAGVYNLTLQAGSYDVLFNRYGLETLNLPGVNIPGSDTVMVDTTMMPVVVPVDGVVAEVLYYDYGIEVSWHASGPNIIEKSNDEGEVSDLFVEQVASSQVAVKYDNDYDHIVGGRIYVGDGTFPGPFLGTDFLVRVYDDEGMAGLPGNTLDEETVFVDQYGWIGFDSLDAWILNDNYYLDMYQLNDAPACAPVGYTQYPADSNSLIKYGEYGWYPFPLGNAMIRPWVSAPHDSLYITSYRVCRYSCFCLECDPQSGTLTELAATGNWYYHDFALGGLPGGCYAYGIKAIYNNGLYAPIGISNIVCFPGQINVTINLIIPDSSSDGLTRIKLTGQTVPFNKYSGIIQNSDSGGFDDVNFGKYKLEIYKPGYDKFIQDSIDIQSDTAIEVTLQENRYPIEDLTVNPFTGFLKWEPNNIVQFSWQNDTGETCHSLTTSELDLTLAEHWTLTVCYNYNSNVEPALVDYSTDQGRTWAVLDTLIPHPTLDTIDIDLSEFSGVEGEQEIMFQIHDFFGAPYYLDLKDVKIWTPDLKMNCDHYNISLNNEAAGNSDTAFYQLTSLENGKSYHAGVNAVYSTGITDTVFTDFIYHELFIPENFKGIEDDDTLRFTWSPPAGSWDSDKSANSFPDALKGYIVYFESKDISLSFDINDPLDTSFSMHRLTCDTIYVALTAVYDLSGFEIPGTTLESESAGPLIFNAIAPISYEFSEDWSSMNYYRNCWITDGEGMAIESNQGNPGPALTFHNPDEPYQSILTSHPIFIPQSSDGYLVLEFDLNLISNGESGHETLEFQVLSEGSTNWVMVKGISNLLGDIDWLHFSVNLNGCVFTSLFRIRLKFAGYGGEATYWTIDNILVHNLCTGPQMIIAEKSGEDMVKLTWLRTKPKADSRNFENYRIYSNYNGPEYLLLAETIDTSYLDTLTKGGKYCYRVTAIYDDQGVFCESPVSDSACITSFLGVPDNYPNSRVVCYPNPAEEYIMIRSDEEIQLITVYNSLGMNVSTIENPGNSYKLDLNSIPPGIYLIRVDLSNQVFLKKIIHQ